MGAPAQLRCCQSDDCSCLQIVGRGTMFESPTFRAIAEQLLRANPDSRVLVDLESCEYLDSTFLGCLVALHKAYTANSPSSRFAIAENSDARQRLLSSTGVDRVLKFDVAPEIEEPAWQEIPICRPGKDTLGAHVLECHERLAEQQGPQAEVFKKVANQLRSDLEKS